MTESDLDYIFELLEEGFYLAEEFAEDECLENDDESFEILFKDRMRPYIVRIREKLVKIALERRRK